jgi:thioredoxin
MLRVGTTEVFSEGVLDASLNRLVIVDFWATWCGPCKMLKPVLERIALDLPDALDVVLVDIETNKELADQYHVSGTPTLLFFKDGLQVDNIVGAKTKPQLMEYIEKYI